MRQKYQVLSKYDVLSLLIFTFCTAWKLGFPCGGLPTAIPFLPRFEICVPNVSQQAKVTSDRLRQDQGLRGHSTVHAVRDL